MNDTVEFSFLDEIDDEIRSITEAASNGTLTKWVEERWKGPGSWTLDPETLLSDRISSLFIKYIVTVYECENCGCLWVQEKGKDTFLPYNSESKSYKSILKEPEKNA